MKDSWWKRGLLAAEKQKGAPLQQRLDLSFDVFLTNEGDGFLLLVCWDAVPGDEIGVIQKMGAAVTPVVQFHLVADLLYEPVPAHPPEELLL